MRRKAGFIWAGSMVGLAMPVKGLGAAIVEYNFGNSATAFTYAATTIAPNVTASGIDSTNDFGDADTFTVDAGQTSRLITRTIPAAASIFLASKAANPPPTTISGSRRSLRRTRAMPSIPPASSCTLGRAAPGAMQSAYIYDSADDALDPNITPTATGGPTGTDTMANPLQGSGTFTAVRSTSSDMNEIQVANFPSTDVNLTSFTVRVYFDTQGNVNKNIDLGYLELDGSVVALPVNLSWNNTDGTGDGVTWDIGNNQNWNNGSGPATYSDGSNVTFDDNNVNNYAVTLNDTVSPGSVTFGNNNLPYTLSGIGSIAGTGSLTMNGASTVFLSNTGINSYSGGTNVSAGTLVIGAAGALPANSASPSPAVHCSWPPTLAAKRCRPCPSPPAGSWMWATTTSSSAIRAAASIPRFADNWPTATTAERGTAPRRGDRRRNRDLLRYRHQVWHRLCRRC